MIYFITSTLANNAPNQVLSDISKNIKQENKICYIRETDKEKLPYFQYIEEKPIKVSKNKHSFKKEDVLILNDIICLNEFKDVDAKKIAIVHSNLKDEYKVVRNSLPSFKKIKIFLKEKYHEKLLKEVDMTVGVSENVEEYLKKIGVKNRTYICNAIDYSKMPNFKKEFLGTLNIVQTGNITEGKNIIGSLFLIKKMIDNGIDLRLHICGHVFSDKYMEEVKKTISSLELQKYIICHGFLSKEQLFEHYKYMDMFIMLSKVEGLSLALLESLYFGMVPVVSDYPSLSSVVKSIKKGFIIDKSNREVDDLIAYVKQRKYVDDYKIISHRSKAVFDFEKMIKKYEKVILEVQKDAE